MGLFDKKDKRRKTGGRDDFDSPVEQIDLSAPEAAPDDPDIAISPAPSAALADPPSGAQAATQSATSSAKSTAKTAKTEEPVVISDSRSSYADDDDDNLDYGIQQAIELMRTLPMDNVELVVQVVKHTLESTKIRISRIIEDATERQESIQGKIRVRKSEIAELEAEIATRRDEIAGMEADYSETSTVKDRLQLAERLSKQGAAPPKATSAENKAASASASAVSGSPSARPARITAQQATPTSAASTEASGPKSTVVVKK